MPLLWNLQTQQPEWVRPEDTAAKLKSGSFREYQASGGVFAEAGAPEIQRQEDSESAAAREQAGVRPVSAPELQRDQRVAAERAAEDTFGGEVQTFAEGALAGVSAGLVDPADISKEAATRRSVNPLAGTLGYATGVVGGAALDFGPAGLITRGAGRAGEAASAIARTPGARLAVKEAVQGTVEGAGFSAGAQLGGAVWADRPFSAEALATDALLGGALGAGLAGVKLGAGRIGRAAKSADDLVSTGSELSKGVAEDFRAVGSAWDGALDEARNRVGLLRAARDARELPDILKGGLANREAALEVAERAQKDLRAALHADEGDSWARLMEVLDTGTPKRVQKVLRHLDEYGAAMAKLDEGLTPSGVERALAPEPQLARRPVAPGTPVDALEPGARTALGKRAAPPTNLPPDALPVPAGPAGSGFVTETFGGLGPPLGTVDTGPMATPAPGGFRRTPGLNAPIVPGRDFRAFMAGDPGRAAVQSPTQLADLLSARLGKLDGALMPRGASLDYAEHAGLNVNGLGPLGERAAQLWGLRKYAKSLGSARPERGLAGRIAEEVAALGADAAVGGHPAIRYGARSAARAAVRLVSGAAETIGRAKESVAHGVESLLSDGRAGALRRGVMAADYGEGSTRDFERKDRALRAAASSPDALRTKLAASSGISDLRGMDPDMAAAVTESAAARVEHLAGALPPRPAAEAYPAVAPGTVPHQLEAVRAWENVERVHADPARTALAFARGGAVPPEVVEALRTGSPQLMTSLAERTLSAGPEALSRAPHASLLGLSQILGYPLVPEADAGYRFRQQERFRAARQKSKQIMANQQGAAAIRAGIVSPTPGQVMAVPPPPPNLR